ncbi:glucose-1-phosphate cytidylyltransferase [Niveispirillum sp. SYP-B3756]|uniref:glucose-1-phosphate cytidylyltransferase n=1 Tax=Niveispirillum sp. SYP-B3756 TaxID=2662178 RepID=UPI0012915D8B|nr:glucose-1-phosphate cytidylyltransferase [Niveispirillum sp. SYP-B3756]MQP64906.1 glucose-1-phosphate cytidylyltransferase [Niveispirillum sp. SYP-B3756]
MKAVILAGGSGTRLAEETEVRPKPMVEIGGYPIIWHIMKIYAQHGVRDFVVCLGYKGYAIKEYFVNYWSHASDITVNTRTGKFEVHRSSGEDWSVSLVDTGQGSMTGGRLRRVRDLLGDDDFMMTYGDGVANVDVTALLAHHRAAGKQATVTAVRPPGRFGALDIENGVVQRFLEKPQGDGGLINGGFFVLSPKVIDRISGDETIWEQEPLEGLAADGQLAAYLHTGFWQPMDTLRDKKYLESLWQANAAPWKTW